MKINIKTIYETYEVEINDAMTVGNLKDMIEKKYGASRNEQKLFITGTCLNDDNKTLKSYYISEETIIILNIQFREFTVHVTLPDNTSFDVKMKPSNKIRDLKSVIEKESSFKVAEQVLLIKSQALDDDKSFSENGIIDNCVIKMIPRVNTEMKQVNIRMEQEQNLAINLECGSSISKLKREICSNIRIDPTDIKLLYKERELQDNDTVDQVQGAFAFIQLKSNVKQTPINILVKLPDNRTLLINILISLKCIELKKKIQEKIGGSIDEIFLKFNACIMEDNKFLDEYHLQNNSTIEYFVRLREGL